MVSGSLEHVLSALCLVGEMFFTGLKYYVFCSYLADIGMRVGADYQANIPEFEPGEVFVGFAE